MKHNTFEPCKGHENGHFGWCLLCEIEQLRKELRLLGAEKMRNDFAPWKNLECYSCHGGTNSLSCLSLEEKRSLFSNGDGSFLCDKCVSESRFE